MRGKEGGGGQNNAQFIKIYKSIMKGKIGRDRVLTLQIYLVSHFITNARSLVWPRVRREKNGLFVANALLGRQMGKKKPQSSWQKKDPEK